MRFQTMMNDDSVLRNCAVTHYITHYPAPFPSSLRLREIEGAPFVAPKSLITQGFSKKKCS